MNLATLKSKLIVVTGTSIGEVLFDWQEYLNEQRVKTYPVCLWSLTSAKFNDDVRTTTMFKEKLFTFNLFFAQSFDALTEDKITVWDALEVKAKAYLNLVNSTAGLTIENINNLNGEYLGEGVVSIDSEIGIWYKDVQLKAWC